MINKIPTDIPRMTVVPANEPPIPFTREECAAMIRRKPVMAQILEMAQKMGIAKIVD